MKNRRNIVEQQNPPQNPNDIWLKDGKFYRSTSEGWAIVDSKLEYTNKETMIADNPKGGTIGIDKESGAPSIYNDVTKQWSPLGGGVTETTWQELKDKRDAGKLTTGALYRITDYQCTTTQENTRSAGHQFDIVLLALSENKLAEEGWAMMHDNIYDVTFDDGVTKKCWLYLAGVDTGGNQLINVVDTESRLGIPGAALEEFTINESGKTAFTEDWTSAELGKENLTYNYFQNSNLSAWKVWYSLDNDTNRFAWADDSVDEGSLANIECTIFDWDAASNVERWYRNPSSDVDNKYYWIGEGSTIEIYTDSENPTVGASVYNSRYYGEIGKVSLFNPSHQGTNLPNGRGVIYRLIDEWNNDVPYDFKNIQLYLPIVEGKYDSDGEKSWVYTFCLYNNDVETYEDGSLKRIEVSVDDTYIVSNNIFMAANFNVRRSYSIRFNVALGYYSLSNEEGFAPYNCIYVSCNYAVITDSDIFLYHCAIKDFVAQSSGIYYYSKKVLTES